VPSEPAVRPPPGGRKPRTSLGDAVQRLGAAIRYHGALSDRAREVAVLMVAASVHSGFEQHAHEHLALRVGVTESEVRSIRENGELDLDDPEEAAIARTTRRLLDRGSLTDTEYADAVETLGPARLFELTALVGFYRLIAMLLHVGVDRPQ
jgi:4-carboxymuconolactone decarboxylase